MPSVCFIDPSFTRKNPSTCGLVDVAAELVARGWEVEVRSDDLQPELAGKVIHRKAPRFDFAMVASAWFYFVYYHFQAALDWLNGRKRADVVVSTGFLYLPADLATVHFSHFDFLKAGWLRGRKTPGLCRNIALMASGLLSEIVFLWNPWRTHLLTVSESVSGDMARYAAPWKRVSLLPNQADVKRFYPAYREQVREEARRLHGFGEEEKVLLFASAGHHFRKGFFQAVPTIARLRESGLPVRMLVVGGHDKTLARVRGQLAKSHPGSEKWLTFTGATTTPEFHFSAADALFFPSLSEAFSLVEIEAAALGLPLYLTPHHGSEMILRDGDNGRLLPWEVEGMTAVLESEIHNSHMRFTDGSTGGALSKDEYFDGWLEHLEPLVGSDFPDESPRKPKLMLVGHTYGLEVNREKALHLAEFFEVRVCTCDLDGWKVLGKEVVDHQSPAHEAAYQLRRLRRWPRWQDYTKIAFRGLRAEISDFQPDIVLVENEPWSLLRWQTRVASWLAAPRAKFAEFTWENVKRSGLKGWLVDLFYQAAALTGGQVICGNRSARELCMEAGFPESDTKVAAQLGINLEDHPQATKEEREIWRANLGWPPDAEVLGFCGRLVPEKGLTDLAEATRGLRATHLSLKLVLVGDGSLRKELEAIDPEGVWLKVLPPVRHQAIPAFLNKLDIFILPSKPMKTRDGQVWEEQFGHVLIEAMACGVLTLGSDSGAIPEVLADPEVTFRHSDRAALTAMIDHWLIHPREAKAKAEQQRQICSESWTHGAVSRAYLLFLGPGR